MSLFSRGLVAAMEDEAANQELAIDEAGAESMEADLVEAVDLAADIDSGTNEMEQTVKDADQLERHVEVLTDAEEEGGASPEVVEATEIAVEAIYNRLGIYSGTGIPALESFTTKTGRARYTTEAIDSIKAKIKQIWEAVVNAFKKLVNYVKDFFAKLFDANKKMLARVNSLRAKAKDIKGTAKEKISGSGISTVVTDLTVAGLNAADIKHAADSAVHLTSYLNGIIEAVSSEEKFNSYTYEASSDISPAKAQAPEGMVWDIVYEIGGNKIIQLVSKESAKGADGLEKEAKYSVKTEKGDKKEAGEIAPLSVAEIGNFLSAIESKVNELMQNKTVISGVQVKLEQAVAKISSIASQASADDKNVGNRSTKARSAATAVANGATKLVTSVAAETTRVCQAYLTYVDRSISAYSESNEKEASKK